MAGAVLGKRGATVAAIKRDTGAYVQFTRPGTATNSPKDRMMIIAVDGAKGTHAAIQTAVAAVQMVLAAVEAEGALDKLCTKQFAPDKIFLQQVIPSACAGKVMGPGGEAIKSLSSRTGCSVVVEGKSPNAAFVPFRLVNYLAPGPAEVAAAVAEVAELICQEEKYDAGGCGGWVRVGGWVRAGGWGFHSATHVLVVGRGRRSGGTVLLACTGHSWGCCRQRQQACRQPRKAGACLPARPACPSASVPTRRAPCLPCPPALPCPLPRPAGIKEVSSVCFRIIEIPDRKVGALLGPSGAHIKNLQEVLRCKMGVADFSIKPGSRFVR